MADDIAKPASQDNPEEPIQAHAEQPGEASASAPPAGSPEAPFPDPTPGPPPEAPPGPELEPAAEAAVAVTLEVPPLEPGQAAPPSAAEGGEWELLVGKLRQWLATGQLQQLWSQARTPLTALAVLLGALLVLRIYSSLVGAIDSLPLVPGLLELTGLIWLVRFGVPKLLRRSEREKLLGGLQKRRQDFLG